jgi:hypothetical protein
MPQLDMSQAILEPWFVDQYLVKRRLTGTNKYGEVQVGLHEFTAYGVVTIHDDNALKRGADEQHAAKTIHIVSQTRLRTAVEGYQPDLVLWHGSEFVAIKNEDYTGYGAGWTQTTLTSQKFMDPAPGPGIGIMDFSSPMNSAMTGVLPQCC